tara:strand:+ start:117 stop:1118 length:1002 start_codon:yes stop_codon:yes gene_type:complete
MFNNFLKKIYTSGITSKLVKVLSKPWKGKGAILVYHRVLPDNEISEDLNMGLAVSCSQFEKQVQLLSKNYSLVSIDEFIETIDKQKNKFLVTLTFDDGYKDNLKYALPILEKYNIPATIYMSTRFLEKKVSMWWYEIKKLIENNQYLKFKFKEKNFNLVLKNRKQKEIAFHKIRELFLNLKTADQLNLLELITKTQKREDYAHSCLTPEELKILDKNPLITIGSHTHNHLNLKILNDDELISEVKKSLEILEKLLGHNIKHFSYPYGGIREANTREYDLVKSLNVISAVTSRAFPIKKTDPFVLPRIYVGKNTCEKSVINHLTGFYNLVYRFL